MSVVNAEIIAIGNELLIGDVQDTNTAWLCARITGLGGVVRRATLIPDDRQIIAETLHAALARGTQLILTCGGLGPTDDDMTLASLAYALGLPLLESPEALAMLTESFQRFYRAGYTHNPDLTPERRKMAMLPAGGQPLANPVGAAPGVLLRHAGSVIVCFPGVPEELIGIFEGALGPLLRDLFGTGCYDEWVVEVRTGDESQLAPAVNRLQRDHPGVYVKSRARPYGATPRLKITLCARGDDCREVSRLLQAARQDLGAAVSALGIEIISG